MNQEKIWQDFSALPYDAQQQVADFVEFLLVRYTTSRRPKSARPTRNLAEEPFIGMWSEREDMQDSSGWVRQVREREWVTAHE